MAASRKRRLLAWYLDLLLFGVVTELLFLLIGPVSDYDYLIALCFFVPIRFAIAMLMVTPGEVMLSIAADGTVDSEVYDNETWLTMLLGVLFMKQGTEELVGWITLPDALPLFGFLPEGTTAIALDVSIGLFFAFTGCLVLKVYRIGLWLGVVATVLTFVSSLMSWRLWIQLSNDLMMGYRAMPDLPLNKGSLVFAYAAAPNILLVCSVLGFILFLISARRLSR